MSALRGSAVAEIPYLEDALRISPLGLDPEVAKHLGSQAQSACPSCHAIRSTSGIYFALEQILPPDI